MLNKLRKPFEPIINVVAKPFSLFHPDFITLLSVVISIPGFYFYTQGNAQLGSLFILGAILDIVDGAVARMRRMESGFGGILDATVDRVYEGILLLSIGIGGLVPWELIFTFYIASITVSYIKAKAEAVTSQSSVGTNEFSVGIGSRGERILLLFVGSLLSPVAEVEGLNLLGVSIVILTIAAAITVLWRGVVIRRVTSQPR